ncbi:tRNA (adenosine(37)-N6)-threonylcarbamoyltransferase complex ATPase subunit type 1 TsaE [bacterium]|nr:tRNA (adenosine(37)-N6)-threonylcarbamoyltransferase complex ATPase subunit type 1 TsaE [bacterium]|tara:strand:- start:1228 stop:1659 length:432 start_codon:yes stop_codon:yes gene_type:complete
MRSFSEQDTKQFAAQFVKKVFQRKSKGALVVALSGELGAGKTVFAKGFAKGLGLRKRIVSPTFVFVRRHEISGGQFRNFYHVDAYRVQNKKSLAGLGLDEVFSDSTSLVLVEWAENVKSLLPKDTVWVRIKHGKEEKERIISI